MSLCKKVLLEKLDDIERTLRSWHATHNENIVFAVIEKIISLKSEIAKDFIERRMNTKK